jgi:hypothetical protein
MLMAEKMLSLSVASLGFSLAFRVPILRDVLNFLKVPVVRPKESQFFIDLVEQVWYITVDYVHST